MGNTRFIPAALVLLALLPSPARAGGGVGAGPDTLACVPPAPPSPARCTMDIWGWVTDPDGVPVAGATVSDGRVTIETDYRGFYDLYVGYPGPRNIVARSSSTCSVGATVNVDAATAVASGGVNRNIQMPCRRPSYNAFGFAVVQKGSLISVARSGISHVGGFPGALEWYELPSGGPPARPRRFLSSEHDDRNTAGGLTGSGALMVFFARYDTSWNHWGGLHFIRAAREGAIVGTIPHGSLTAFSPYGPLVILPSERLMQTVYGTDGRNWRIYTTFSGDDGRTWSSLNPIDVWPPFHANEAAAVYLDGNTDETARILLVARTYGYNRRAGRWHKWFGLSQYLSPNGGRTWHRLGVIPGAASRGEVMPWMTAIEGGKLVLVWADRGDMTLKRSITPFRDAIARRWWRPEVLYRSRVGEDATADAGDFGYPSIASYGPGAHRKAVVFNDADPAGSADGLTDVDMFVLPLWATPPRPPVAISP